MLDPKEKRQTITRLKRIEGHLKKVCQMVESDEYCIDIITQSMAVQSALRSVDEFILKRHLATCVKDALTKNKNADSKIDEIMRTIKFSRK